MWTYAYKDHVEKDLGSSELIDFSGAPCVAFDVETVEEDIKKLGPGAYRGTTKLIGFSFSDGERAQYYPVGHNDTTKGEAEKSLNHLRDQFKKIKIMVCQNCLYDLEVVKVLYGIDYEGKIHDTLVADAILWEHHLKYDLTSIAGRYSLPSKNEQPLRDYAAKVGFKKDIKSRLDIFPTGLVASYCCYDSYLTLEVLKNQLYLLDRRKTRHIYRLECDGLPLLLYMRELGVRIDRSALSGAKKEAEKDVAQALSDIHAQYGNFNVNSNDDVTKLVNELNIPDVPWTDKSLEPGAKKKLRSTKRSIIERIDHPFLKSLLRYRDAEAPVRTFKRIEKFLIGDRLRTQFFPVQTGKGSGGTITGRHSSSKPALQNIAKKRRNIFIADEGCIICKADYSQAEVGVFISGAIGPGAEEHRQALRSGKDYHSFVAEITGLDRGDAKKITFGLLYGMRANGLMVRHGWSREKTESILLQYYAGMPFAKETIRIIEEYAKSRNPPYVKTILGRRLHLSDFAKRHNKYYKCVNKHCQGSVADILKTSILSCYKKKIFGSGCLKPALLVHDEIVCNVPINEAGYAGILALKETAEISIGSLTVPIPLDVDIGRNWREVVPFNRENWDKLKSEILS